MSLDPVYLAMNKEKRGGKEERKRRKGCENDEKKENNESHLDQFLKCTPQQLLAD